MRRITFFVSALLVALFASLSAYTAPASAQEAGEERVMATWSGNDLRYIQWTFKDSNSTSEGLVDLSVTECNDSQYVYFTDREDRLTQPGEFIGVICLDSNNKSEIIDATLAYFVVDTPGANNFRFDNVEDRIEVAPEGTPDGIPVRVPDDSDADNPDDATDGESTGTDRNTTTCSSEYTFGLGWIICPVTNWLAHGMDQLFGVLTSFLKVSPLSTEREGNPIFYMWSIMRNLANVLFIIGFLVIIYSQITGYGISNYGVKKLLPRIVVAAVMVNISYWVTALAVDASNILGMALQSAFQDIRAGMPTPENITLGPTDFTWQAMAATALSGGAGAAVVGGAIFGLFATAGASLWFLLVGLMGVAVSILVALLVLAARQAIITILIIVSPLAFVALILPGTDKYFERWRSLFTTLLLVFPLMSIVFGGAQLAGLAIIYSAFADYDPNTGQIVSGNAFNLVILGMIVQVAPLIITPLLIKLSGSLVTRISGMVNNPNKGLLDQTRKFAQNRHDMTKNRMWESTGKDRNGNIIYRRNDPLAMAARRKALKDMDFAHRIKAYEAGAEAAYEQDHRSHAVHAQSSVNEMLKAQGADAGRAAVAREIATNEALQRLYMQKHISHESAELADNQNKSMIETMKVKPSEAAPAMRNLADQIQQISNQTLDETQRQTSIHQEHDSHYWQELASDEARRAYAGAVGIAHHGETRIANTVRQKQQEDREKRISAAISNLDTVEARLEEERAVILGDIANAGRFASLAADADSRSGALRRYIGRAPIKDVQSLMEKLDITISANGDVVAETLRSELVGALSKRKPFYVSQTLLTGIAEGTLGTQYRGPSGKTLMIKDFLNAKGLGAQTMVQADRDDLQAVLKYLQTEGIGTLDIDARVDLKRNIEMAFTDNRLSAQMDKRINELEKIRGLL